ncbi:sensor domain-containing diguanylate cyclase [Grimontia celer]|nr:sensor domain-containing diguanylate cyclase [Grimontia celer]
MSESEMVIRRIYQITNDYEKGLDHQIHELIKMGLERFNLDIGILSLIDGNTYLVRNVVCPESVPLKAGDSFSYDLSYCWVTLDADGPVAIENVGETQLLGNHPAYHEFGLESYIGIPIRVNNKVQGTLNFTSPEPYPRKFREIDVDSLYLMASWLEVEFARKLQQEELENLNAKLEALVRLDPLTGLPNRRHLFEHIDSRINKLSRKASKGAMVLLDLDHFKQINDTFGHQFGDKVLEGVGNALKTVLRNYDLVGRYGGEEFLLWLEDVDVEQVERVCKRIQLSLNAIEAGNTPVTASMGICYFAFDGKERVDPERVIANLVSRADRMLYQAKSSGRNRFESIDSDTLLQEPA